MKKIGIIQGAGTGPELISVFKEYFQRNHLNDRVAFEEVKTDNKLRPLHSFQSLKPYSNKAIRDISTEQSAFLFDTVRTWHQDHGIRTVFRTATNAESLYQYRQKVGALKEIHYTTDNNCSIMIMRDMLQGFYANQGSYVINNEQVDFSATFNKGNFQQIITRTRQVADQRYGHNNYKCLAFYKHHLFGRVIKEWFAHDQDIDLHQPDAGIKKLVHFCKHAKDQNLVIIASNEIGDVLREMLMLAPHKEEEYYHSLFAKSYYLHKPFDGSFVEYQTAHGSADDKKGTGEVSPLATLRVAAIIAEKELSIPGAEEQMSGAIKDLEKTDLGFGEESILNNTRYVCASIFRFLKNHPINGKSIISRAK